MNRIEEIADGLFVMSDLVGTERGRSWLPPGTEGFEPFNKYLLRNDKNALLIDTGVAVHRQNVLKALDRLTGKRALTIMVTRSELECIGNLGAIVDRFPDLRVLSSTKNLPLLGLAHFAHEPKKSATAQRIVLGETLCAYGFEHLRVIEPLIRTLSTIWVIDERQGTLFSSDLFANELLADSEAPLQRRDLEELPSVQLLRQRLLAKFDWLARADTSRLQAKWDEFFATFVPAVIAPALGRVHIGHDVSRQIIARYRSAIFGDSDMVDSSNGGGYKIPALTGAFSSEVASGSR